MPKTDARIDAYIAKSAEFARPILKHLRKLVHAACPDAVETIKWGMPHFDHRGMMCGMAAFQQHCTFGFWKSELVFGKGSARDDAMGQFGRITSLAGLPHDKTLTGYIKKAAALNESGIKSPKHAAAKKKKLVVPDYFLAALRKNKKALTTFEDFSPSHQREYVEWITEAKREETRAKRLKTALSWLAQGKSHNWRYR